MSLLKYALSALVAANLARAQCSAGTTTIKDQATAAALAQKCRTFTGVIAIATSNTEPIDLSGIEMIKNGGIYAANNPNLQSLTANDLVSIQGGSFYLSNVTQLSTIDFPLLSSVDILHWTALASLYGWTLTTGIQSASSVVLQDTMVSSLTGLNLTTVNTLVISNNNLLTSIDMQLQNITGAVIISQNGRDPAVSFPDLTSAVNMTFSGVSSLDLPSLKSVNQTLEVQESGLSEVLLPKLTQIGGLALVNNDQLTKVTAPKLSNVQGALTIANDTSLAGTIAFPELTTVGGAVKMDGSFTSVSLPSITLVRGAFDIESTQKLGDTCSPFEAKKNNQDIQGPFTCLGASPTASSSSGSGSGSGSGTGTSSGSSTSTAAASTMDRATPMIGGLLGLFLAIIGLL